MKYENAMDILPKHLLEELQKYASGQLLYVPAANERKSWGQNSGLREKLKRRNIMIQNKYAHGVTITELAEQYFLSMDSIRKIIYTVHKEEELSYKNTIESAVNYANAGVLEEWMESYHLFSSKNKLSLTEQTSFYGVVKLPIRLIHMRINVTFKIGQEQRIADFIDSPPLIVSYRNHQLWCEKEQEEYLLRLKEDGRNTYPSIIMIPEEDYAEFNNRFGNVLFYM